jgi:phosphatidylglycerophosphate synthase
MLGNLARKMGDRLFGRVNARLTRAGVAPEWTYALALASALSSSLSFLRGLPWLGLTLVTLHGIFDYLDGGLRRTRGEGGPSPRVLGMDAHALVDKTSEVALFAGLAGGGWVNWPLGIAGAITSVAVTVVGRCARRWLALDPARVLFDRTDRVLAILLAGSLGAFEIALVLVCLMNLTILLQRLGQVLSALAKRDRAA